jgi:hypothetical protein
MYLEGFEPAIPASELPQTHILDRTATDIGCCNIYQWKIHYLYSA